MKKKSNFIIKSILYSVFVLIILLIIAMNQLNTVILKKQEYQDYIKEWTSNEIGVLFEYENIRFRLSISGPEIVFYDVDLSILNPEKNLIKADVDLICLAGYLKMIPKNIVIYFENRILNIHPALLPDFGGKGFYGMKVHEAVIQSNAVESGATVHFVDNKYDHGPIIAQKKVMILNTDNAEILAEKVLKVEHKLYPEVIKAFCENRINWESGLPKIVKYNQ